MKTKKQKSTTELVFILDKSGSMNGLETDTIGGFNSMIEKQKNQRDECYVTTVLFNHEMEILHDRVKIDEIPLMTDDEYSVDGMTALYDAIGFTIQKLPVDKSDDSLNEKQKVLFVIITDGYENSSREYSKKAIKSLIEHRKSKFDWEFIFLGANIDASTEAENIGISRNRSANYKSDSKGTNLNFKILGSLISEYRDSYSISEHHLEEIRDDEKSRK